MGNWPLVLEIDNFMVNLTFLRKYNKIKKHAQEE